MAILCTSNVAANATDYIQGGVNRTKTSSGTGVGHYLKTHPKVKGAVIGTGAGAGAGALTGLISGKGIARGAAIGAGTGAGVGILQGSKIMQRHKLVKDTAQGSLVGLGLSMAATRGHGSGKKVAGATAIGGALGLGAGFLKDKLK
jgi:hypothetical protein